MLIALGLYGLLWGKFRETAVHEAEKIAEHDMKMEEVPHPTIFNGKFFYLNSIWMVIELNGRNYTFDFI